MSERRRSRAELGEAAFRDFLRRDGSISAWDFFSELRDCGAAKELLRKYADSVPTFLSAPLCTQLRHFLHEAARNPRLELTGKPKLLESLLQEVQTFLREKYDLFLWSERLVGDVVRSSTLPRSHNSTPRHKARLVGLDGGGGRRSFSRESGVANPYNVITPQKPYASDDGASDLTMTDTSTLVEDPRVKEAKRRRGREERSHSASRPSSSHHHSRHRQPLVKPAPSLDFFKEVSRKLQRTQDTDKMTAQLEESLKLKGDESMDAITKHDLPDLEDDDEEERPKSKVAPFPLNFGASTSAFGRGLSDAFANPNMPRKPPPLPTLSPYAPAKPFKPPPLPSQSPYAFEKACSSDSGLGSGASSLAGGSVFGPPPLSLPRQPKPLPKASKASRTAGLCILYSFNEQTPFMSRWEPSPAAPTLSLGAFKLILPPKLRDAAAFRYFFTCRMDGDEVHLELCHDDAQVPTHDQGKVKAKILPR